MEKVNKEIENLRKPKKKKRGNKSKFIIIAFILIVLIIVITIVVIKKAEEASKYKYYTDKMYEYGYNELYNNKKATYCESVTNIEAIKVIVGALNNKLDIDKIYTVSKEYENEDEKWFEYWENIAYDTMVEKEDLKLKAKKMDVLIMLIDSVEKFLIDRINTTNIDFNDEMYTSSEIDTISKAVTLGLIKNNHKDLKNENITKGMLNKYIIEIVEMYSTRYYAKIVVDGNGNIARQNINIVKDENKMPSNYEIYPYIIDKIDKDIYEIELKNVSLDDALNPKETYNLMGELYMQTHELIENYFDAVLNVNYETISISSFKDLLNNYVLYELDEQDVEEYVKYVKANKIKLKGKATPLIPILYYDGNMFRVRTKITFEVINSDTSYNLIFGDEKENIEYYGEYFDFYVDLPLSMTSDSYSLLVKIECMAENIVKLNSNIKVE